MRFEDENMMGYFEMLVWNVEDKLQDRELLEIYQLDVEEILENFYCVVFILVGVLGWFIG